MELIENFSKAIAEGSQEKIVNLYSEKFLRDPFMSSKWGFFRYFPRIFFWCSCRIPFGDFFRCFLEIPPRLFFRNFSRSSFSKFLQDLFWVLLQEFPFSYSSKISPQDFCSFCSIFIQYFLLGTSPGVPYSDVSRSSF